MLVKRVFHLTHQENFEETKEVFRKPGRLSLPLWILINCVIQDTPYGGHRDSEINGVDLAEMYYNIMAKSRRRK